MRVLISSRTLPRKTGMFDPDQHLEIEARLPHLGNEAHHRGLIRAGMGKAFGALEQDLPHLVHVAAVGHAGGQPALASWATDHWIR